MNIRILVLAGLALGLSLSVAAADQKAPDPDVAAGWTAFNNNEYAKARAAWEKAAKRGVGAAYDGLGQIFLEGAGVEPDPVEARRLYELGAARQDPASIIQLARMLGRGHGGPEDMERARQLLGEVIIAHRDLDAETAQQAERTLLGLEEELAHERAVENQENDAQAAIEAELKWNDQLAKDTRPGAAEYREGVAANDDSAPEKAFAAWKRSAELGYPAAFGRLGLLYSGGWGVAKDKAEGRRLLAHGASKGDAAAMLHLGNDLAEGDGGPVDRAQAKYWYEKVLAHPEPPPGFQDWAGDALARLPEDVVAAQVPATFAPPQLFAPKASDGAAEYAEGDGHFKKKEYTQAFAAWRKSAALGYAPAFADLGLLYQLGTGCAQDRAEARRLYQQGAAKNDPDAMLQLAHDLRDGTNGMSNQAQAKYWYTRMANHPAAKPAHRQNAQEALARMGSVVAAVPPGAPPLPAAQPAPVAAKPVAPPAVAQAPKSTKPGQAEFAQARAKVDAKDVPGAIALLEQAAGKGHVQAALDLASMYSMGIGVTKDVAKAVALVEKAAATGDPEAVKYLAAIAAESKGGALDYEKGMEAYAKKKVKDAVAFWEKAAAQGHVQAMVELGFTLENGEEDAAPDPKASFTWFQRAAEKNNFNALLGVGRAYLDGRAVPADLAKAREHFEKARAIGAGNAQAVAAADAELTVLKGETPENALRVGFAHYQGKKFAEAMQWFRKASDGGNFGGSFNLGLIHERGEGVPADPAQALVWFEKAKAQGHAKADNSIARMKSRLAGLDEWKKAEAAQQAKQYAEARGWYEKAAAAGNVAAMGKLAEIYQRGIAVVKNRRTALTWYEKAAQAGDDFAANEADALRQEIEMWESNQRMAELAGTIDGVKSAAAGARPGPTVPFDSLIKHTPWTGEQIIHAIKSGADAEALAVAIRTDDAVEFHDSDYRRILALKGGTPIHEWGNLNGALLENKVEGAGKWAKEMANAAIAARRAQINLAPPVLDSAALRARAEGGDAEAVYQFYHMPEEDRKLGQPSDALKKRFTELRELVRRANYRPGFALLGEELEYHPDTARKDMVAATEFYRQAAEAGSAQGASKVADAFMAPGDPVVAPNYFEVEAWLIEAAARARPGQFTVMPPDHKLYLLYGGTQPVGYGFEMRTREEDLRWLREMVRRGGPAGENAVIYLEGLRQKDGAKVDTMLKSIPPEAPPFPAAEVARLEAAAKAGDAAAMLKLADALATGRGMRQHDKRAVDYYEQAAAKGNAAAMRQLAHHYTVGYGVKKDPARQLEWTRRLAETSGKPEDWLAYGDRLANSNDKTQTAAMLAAYEKAVAGNLPAAYDRLASSYQYGWNGVTKDIPKAIEVRLKAATAGDPKAAGRLALLYVSEADHANAVVWARKAWDGGDRGMAIVLARELGALGRKDEANAMYKEAGNDGSEEGQYMYASAMEQVNPAEAYLWHRKLVANPRGGTFKHSSERYIREHDEEQNAPAGSDFAIRRQAKTGDTAAMIEYAKRIASKDREDARSWLRWAVEKGDTTAMLILANELFPTQKDEAMKLVREAVDKGSTQAMVVLANQLAATDMKAGLDWLQKAEAQGNADAKFQLGGLYFQGRGVVQDQPKGVALMLAAAEAGSLPAQFEMGRAYMQGMPGLVADQAKGLALLKKAADANMPQAAAVLGEIHERGVGTPQNLEEAHKYYRKAVSLGLTQLRAKADQLESMLLKGMRPKK